MGFLFANLAAACWGLNYIFSRLGMKQRAADNGQFMTVSCNSIVLGIILLFLSFAGQLPPWNWTGVAIFAGAGILTTGLARAANLVGIRLIGPTRGSAFQISAPLFTALLGWFILGEKIGFLSGLGGLFILGGLWLLTRQKIRAEPLVIPDQDAQPAQGAFLRWDLTKKGFAFAAASAFFFGVGFVGRKWGLVYYPHAIAGAFFGALASWFMIVGGTIVQGRIRQLVEDNMRRIPWWFVAAGAATSVALIAQFMAFVYLPAWIVSLFHGTQALWTLFWSYLFLREEERIHAELVASVFLVFLGVSLVVTGVA